MTKLLALFWSGIAYRIPASWWIGRHESRRARMFIWVNGEAWYWAEKAAGRFPLINGGDL